MEEKIFGFLGMASSILACALGGWDTALKTLVCFMAVDYITGLIVAGVFKKSTKTETGALESRAGWKGLCRKGGTLLMILVAYRLDLMLGNDFIRPAAIIAFASTEAISIAENMGLMGIHIPAVISNAIDVLSKKAGDE